MASIAASNRPLAESIIKLPTDPNNAATQYCFIVSDNEAWQQSAVMELQARCIVISQEFSIDDLCEVMQETIAADGLIFAPMLNKDGNTRIKELCNRNFLNICDSWKITNKKDYLKNESNKADFARAVMEYIERRSRPKREPTGTCANIESINGIELELTDRGKVKSNINNICMVLENDKELQGKFCINVLTKAIWIKCKGGQLPPWRTDEGNYRPIDNLDTKFLLRYMAEVYGIENKEAIKDMFFTVASKYKFNPIAELLNNLKWDGKKRIDTMLSDYLGAEQNEYNSRIMKLVLMGAISRALKPGCKFDYVMILTGPQGNGKTTFCQRLAMDDSLFNNSIAVLDGEKTARQIKGKWIIELGELLAVKRTKDIEAVKGFITQCTDNYAPKYQEIAEDFQRSCIFIGTTNSSSFLSDPTGNRRFLPVATGIHKPKRSLWGHDAHEEFRQIWAEAMELYRSGTAATVADAWLEEELKSQRANYEEENPQAVIISDYLEEHTEIQEICTKQLFFDALQNDAERPERFTLVDARRINDIMQGLKGWKKSEKKKKIRGYGSVYVYYRVYEEDEPKNDKKVAVIAGTNGNQTATTATAEGFTQDIEGPF